MAAASTTPLSAGRSPHKHWCQSDLVAAVAEGFAGHVGGQTVEHQVSAGGARGDGAVVSVERHAGHFLFVVLRDAEEVQASPTINGFVMQEP